MLNERDCIFCIPLIRENPKTARHIYQTIWGRARKFPLFRSGELLRWMISKSPPPA